MTTTEEKLLKEFTELLEKEARSPEIEAIVNIEDWLRTAFATIKAEAVEDEVKTDLRLILDFVERWNKQDAESNISQAAQRLQEWADCPLTNNRNE